MSVFYVERGMLCMQWEGPVSMIDIDIPAEGHVAPGPITAATKQEAFEMLHSVAVFRGVRMCIRAYETTGGLRGFITSHSVSANHLWSERDFSQHLLDCGQDPYYLLGCMGTCRFSVRLSPKWVDGKPRRGETIRFFGLINADVPEDPLAVRFVEHLAEAQRRFDGLDARGVIDAIEVFQNERPHLFLDDIVSRPWLLLEGIYMETDSSIPRRDRTIVRDIGQWKRIAAPPPASWEFLSVSPGNGWGSSLIPLLDSLAGC